MQEGSLVWIEIPATGKGADLKNFYTSLFSAWNFHTRHEEETNTRGGYIAGYELPGGQGGGIVEMPEGCKSQDQVNGNGMTNYYKVEDLAKLSNSVAGLPLRSLIWAQTETKVHELGGKTCLAKTKQGEGGWFMNFLDPQGNRFGAYEFAK